MNLGILEKIELAKKHRNVAAYGAAKGGFMPIGAYWTSHFDLHVHRLTDLLNPLAVVVAACLLFSVSTVWQWGRQSFGHWFKATCFVIGVEGLMVFSPTPAIALVALLLLIGINAIATACNLVAEGIPAPPPTVTDVARARNLPRREAVKVVEQHRSLSAKPVAT